jgi:hypothetical protein
VIEKEYDDADTWTHMQCISNGKGGCNGYMPIQQTDPERWRLKLEYCEDTDCEDGWVSVSEATYNEVAIGDWYDSKEG